MILHEYAVDPEAIGNSWDDFRFLWSLFGVENGRVISRFPKRWPAMVIDASKELSTIDKARIVEKLKKVKVKAISSGRPYDDTDTWLPNALAQHGVIPFHAIISAKEIDGVEASIGVADVDEDHALISVEREIPVKRTAIELTRACADFLCNCHILHFVDPYFRPTRRKWTDVLREFLHTAANGKHSIQRCEYHFLWDDERMTEQEFRRHCDNLADKIPTGIRVRFVGWKEREGGEKFHARYILTNIGGLRFDVGLDYQIGDEGQTTDVGLLDRALYERRLKEFTDDPAFDRVTDHLVLGTRRLH